MSHTAGGEVGCRPARADVPVSETSQTTVVGTSVSVRVMVSRGQPTPTSRRILHSREFVAAETRDSFLRTIAASATNCLSIRSVIGVMCSSW